MSPSSVQPGEYEIHARNAFIVRAYQLGRGWPRWLGFVMMLVGGGMREGGLTLNVVAGASRETAALFVSILWVSLDDLPRNMTALGENGPGEGQGADPAADPAAPDP